MSELFRFLRKIRFIVLFLLLESIALFITQKTYWHHQGVLSAIIGEPVAKFYDTFDFSQKYFHLKRLNNFLSEENSKLRNLLELRNSQGSSWVLYPDMKTEQQYKYISAGVVKNSVKNQNNFIILDKGSVDGVAPDMGVVTSQGIIGVIIQTYPDYSVCMSALNSKSAINAVFKKNNFFGVLLWDGNNRNILKLVDIPKQAPVEIGDTVMTGNKSNTFPPNIALGTVEDFGLSDDGNYYVVDVRLLEDLGNLDHVYIVDFEHRKELRQVEEEVNRLSESNP